MADKGVRIYDAPKIRQLSQGFEIISLDWKYGMAKEKSKAAKEILILNRKA